MRSISKSKIEEGLSEKKETSGFSFISEPKSIPFYFRIPLHFAEKIVGKKLMPARILFHYPRAAIGAFLQEGLIVNRHKNLTKRLLKLVRIQVSLTASCPFCIDMNSANYSKLKISNEELLSLQDEKSFNKITSFSEMEKTAIRYAKSITQSPIFIPEELFREVKSRFTESEIVAIDYTIAQVNFWTRLIQGFAIQPEGFSEVCVYDLNKFSRSNRHRDKS